MPFVNQANNIVKDPLAPGMLTGVYRAVNNILRSIAIFHGPQGCHENLYAQSCFVHDRPEYNSGKTYEPLLPSTILDDSDVVLGPEKS